MSTTIPVAMKFYCILSGSFIPKGPSMPAVKSRTTAPAAISPATEGTKEMLPGTDRRLSQFLALPAGQIHSLPQP